MSLIQRIPWDIQPPDGARVVDRHPSQMWWMPHTGLIGSRFDRVPVQDVCPRGAGLAGKSANIASTLGNGIIYTPPSSTGSWTIFVLYHHTGSGALNSQAITGLYQNGTTSLFHIANEGGGAQITALASSGFNWTGVQDPDSAQSFKLYSIVATLTAGVGQTLSINGETIGVNLVARTPASLDRWTIGFHGGDNNNATDSKIFLAGIVNEAIPLEDARKASENLWAYAFEPRRIFVPMSSGSTAYTLPLDTGSYSITGNDVALRTSRQLSVDTGSYSYTGQATALAVSRRLALDTGSYTYTGQAVGVTATRRLSFDTGVYSYIGNDVTITYTPTGGTTYTLPLDSGSYSYTGQAVGLATTRRLSFDTGTYAYTGGATGLSYSGASAVTIKAGSWLRYRVI